MNGFSTVTQCPRCQQEGVKKVGQNRAVCGLCSKALHRIYQFCLLCQREWACMDSDSCPLPGCEKRESLLSLEFITTENSLLLGCPFFRACPGCKALLTHSGTGCPIIECPSCPTLFCFRCLKKTYYEYDDSDDDDDDDDDDDGFNYDFHDNCTVVNNTESVKGLDQEGPWDTE